MQSHKLKKQTDIGNFPVTKVATVNENVSLNDNAMKVTTRKAVIENRRQFKERKLKRNQKMANKISKEFDSR